MASKLGISQETNATTGEKVTTHLRREEGLTLVILLAHATVAVQGQLQRSTPCRTFLG
jgi:hypothetical protein